MGLTIEELCNLDRVVTRVDVSRWTGEPGSHVCISELSAAEYYDIIGNAASDSDRLLRLIAASLCDESGKKPVSTSDPEAFARAVESARQLPFTMMMALVGEANRLNAVTAGSATDKELEKNSPEET